MLPKINLNGHSGDLSDLLAAFTPAQELQESSDSAAPTFERLSLGAMLDMPPKEWLIHHILGKGDIGAIYGAPGCGKTFAVIDLVMAACTGESYSNEFDIARPLEVAYCAGEGISGLPERFRAAAHYRGVTNLPNFGFYQIVPQLFGSDGDATISRFVADRKSLQGSGKCEKLDLLVIDTLHTATVAADENSAQDMGKMLHACRWAASELGCAVLLVHHTTKGGGSERGSSALRGAADFMIEIRRISDTGTKALMHCSKLKDGEAWKDRTFDLVAIDGFDSVRVWWDEPGSISETDKRRGETARRILEVLIKASGVLTAKQIGEALDAKPQTVNKIIPKLERDGLVSRSQTNRQTWCYAVTEKGKGASQDQNFS